MRNFVINFHLEGKTSPTGAENTFSPEMLAQLFGAEWLYSNICNNCHHNTKYWL